MADFLATKDWNDALKKHKAEKDGGLGDALKAFEKVRGKDSETQADALDEVVTASASAQKALKDQKELLKYVAQVAAKAKETLKRLDAESGEGDESKAVDKLLFKGLKRAKTARMYFAMIARGATEGKLLITKVKVKPTDVAGAKKELGGGRVFRGVCFGEDGRLVFELKKEPPATLEKLLKLTAKVQAGLMIRPLCRMAAIEEELGEEEGDDQETLTKPPPKAPPLPKKASSPEEQQVRSRLVRLAADLKRALAEKLGEFAKIDGLSTEVQNLVRDGAYGDALKKLPTLEGLVHDAVAGGAGAGSASEFTALAEKLAPQAREIIDQKGPNSQELKLALSEALTLGRRKLFDQGLAKLRAVEKMLATSESGSAKREDEEAEPAEAAYTRRLAAVQKLYEQQLPRVQAGDAGRAKALADLHAKMTAAAGKPDFDAALARLEELEPALRSAARAADAREEIAQAVDVGNVPFKALRARWANSQTTARRELAKLKTLVLSHPEITSDPRFDRISDELKGLDDWLPKFDGRLERLLQDADEAKEKAEKAEFRRRAAVAVGQYQTQLAGADKLKSLEATMFGKMSIYREMETSLNHLQVALSK